MGRLSQVLSGYPVVGLDTSIFIYHFESHPDYLSLTQELLEGIENSRWLGITSVIALMELAVRPFQLNQEEAARKTEALLVHFPNLSIVDIDRAIARMAAQLRAQYSLRAPDALQVAACASAGARVFVTNDQKLARLEPVMRVVVLGNYL